MAKTKVAAFCWGSCAPLVAVVSFFFPATGQALGAAQVHATSLQQLAASTLVGFVPALEESYTLFVPHLMVSSLPPHVVLSCSQQLPDPLHAAADVSHFTFLSAPDFFFQPAAHVTLSHVA